MLQLCQDELQFGSGIHHQVLAEQFNNKIHLFAGFLRGDFVKISFQEYVQIP